MNREAMVRQVIAHLVPEDAKPPRSLKKLALHNERERIMRFAVRLLGLREQSCRKFTRGVFLVYYHYSNNSNNPFVFLFLETDYLDNKWYFTIQQVDSMDNGPRLSLADDAGIALLVDAVCQAARENEQSSERLRMARSMPAIEDDDDIPY